MSAQQENANSVESPPPLDNSDMLIYGQMLRNALRLKKEIADAANKLMELKTAAYRAAMEYELMEIHLQLMDANHDQMKRETFVDALEGSSTEGSVKEHSNTQQDSNDPQMDISFEEETK